MKNYKVSVIIPTFNRASLIAETLESVLLQKYTNWECIVVDDGSTDNTEEVVAHYLGMDSRFNFYKRPKERKKGASACRNYGLERSNGDFIQFLDSDDLLGRTKLVEQIKILESYSPLTLVTCKWGSFSTSSSVRVKTKFKSYKNFINGVDLLYNFGKHNDYFPLMVYLVSRELIEKAGKWDENISQNDDGEYFARVLMNTERVVFCETASAYYRAGNTERLSLLNNEKKIRSAIYSWKKIEEQLKPGYKKVAAKYVHNGKRNIYDQIKESHPYIVEEHRDFFKEFTRPKNWLKRMISR